MTDISQPVARTEHYPTSREPDGRMAHRFATGNQHGAALTVCGGRVPCGNVLVRGSNLVVTWCPICFPAGVPT